ncbi:phosphoglycerate kinase [Patescibacteria group bacterium]|nr:phosphoglycerate kinase [Patescibacteria group bacterium]MBU1673433.1 phosphoglycerate kinase [Patescibacteria group bacterium]MBU1963366.1 phosphoglycerate kinase [Patescibacteria group bacterium]
MKTLKDLDVKGKRVLMRADFNVPLNKEGKIEDDNRIRAVLPTINYILEHGGSVILMSHFGRPKGEPDPQYSLQPVAEKLSELLGKKVNLAPDCIGEEAQKMSDDLKPGDVILLENTRFHKEEKENDPEFSKKLAELGDMYVNDAFGAAHRAHASTEGVARLLPHAAGLLLEKEVETLTKVLNNPEKPVVAIIGGAKISTKIQLIKSMLDKVDNVILGGALANTVLLAQNHKIGKSLVEEELAPTVKDLIDNKLRIPVDVICAKEVKEGAPTEIKAVGEVEDDDFILDIGPDTMSIYSELIKDAKTIIWNGPMGVFEIPDFATGTLDVAKAVADSGAYSVVGGGETAQAIKEMGLADKISFISTGGGAMLEFMEGKKLPAIEALN